jgi:hypothetical protein
VGSDLVARTVGAVDGSALDPRRVAEAAGGIVQKTADTLSGARRGKRAAAAAHKTDTSAPLGK